MDPWVRKIPWRRKCQPTPVFLPEKSHGQRSLAGYSQWARRESDMIEHEHNTTIDTLEHKISKLIITLIVSDSFPQLTF